MLDDYFCDMMRDLPTLTDAWCIAHAPKQVGTSAVEGAGVVVAERGTTGAGTANGRH